jgi:hypothetical protein
MHGGASTGAPINNGNAWKHGRFSAEACAERKKTAALLREMRTLARRVDELD